MNEFEIIAKYFSPLAGSEGADGLRNDAASFGVDPDHDVVVTVDAMIEGVHFRADDPVDELGRKLLRVNLSDLAAMGASPLGYVMTTAVTGRQGPEWFEAFAAGLAVDQREFGLHLLGGDTVSSPERIALSLTALGKVPTGRALRRSGAGAGDDIWVSGSVGDGYLGLCALERKVIFSNPQHRAAVVSRYRLPEPRLALGRGLVGLATSVVDVSDGLAADLGHICASSGAGAVVKVRDVPLSAAARAAVRAGQVDLGSLMTGGDDYELLFTAQTNRREAVVKLANELQLPITRIGQIVAGRTIAVVDEDGSELSLGSAGYRHF